MLLTVIPEAQTYTTSGQKCKETKSQKRIIIFIKTISNVIVVIVIFIVIITGAVIPENTKCN